MLTATERRSTSRRRRGVASRDALGTRPSGAVGRARVETALARATERERLILALILLERMSPIEAADTLGISLKSLRRTYRDTLTSLRGALYGFSAHGFETPRSRGVRLERLRRVS